MVDPKALAVNGLSVDLVNHFASLAVVVKAIDEWTCQKSNNALQIVMIAHNCQSDVDHLYAACARRGIVVPASWLFIDSIPMIQRVTPGRTAYNLRSLVEDYLGEEEKHWALTDAVHIFDVMRAVIRSWVAHYRGGRAVDDVMVELIEQEVVTGLVHPRV